MPFYPIAAIYSASPGNPTGTANTSGLMMGLAGAITPGVTGRVFVVITGNIANGTALAGAKVELRLGTGGAPANGGALVGTVFGTQQSVSVVAGAAALAPFMVQALITTLIPGTVYWIDVDLAAITAGTAALTGCQITAFEL